MKGNQVVPFIAVCRLKWKMHGFSFQLFVFPTMQKQRWFLLWLPGRINATPKREMHFKMGERRRGTKASFQK